MALCPGARLSSRIQSGSLLAIMRTIVLNEPGDLRQTDTDAPGPPGAGMALVRVRRVGVCGTDFHAWRGRQPFFTYPRVLGHELGGGGGGCRPATSVPSRAGDRCAVEPYLELRASARRAAAGAATAASACRCSAYTWTAACASGCTSRPASSTPSAALDLDTLALVETLSIGAHAVRRAAPGPGTPRARGRAPVPSACRWRPSRARRAQTSR